MYLPQWVAGTLALLSGSSKLATTTLPTSEAVSLIAKDGDVDRYLAIPEEDKEGAVPTLVKLKGKEQPPEHGGVWLFETALNLPMYWITHADTDLCLAARYDDDHELTEEVALGKCGDLDKGGHGSTWVPQTEDGITRIYLVDNFNYRLAHNGDAVAVMHEGAEGWDFDWAVYEV